jgi:hypothetical protein
MSKYQWISILGLWIMVFLFLGFPAAWDKGVAVVSGLIIVAIAYRGGAALRAQLSQISQKMPGSANEDGANTATATNLGQLGENKQQ